MAGLGSLNLVASLAAIVLCTGVGTGVARACDVCKSGAPRGTDNGSFLEAGSFYAEFSFEYRRWEVIDPLEAVLLSKQDRHLHDFAQERFYHLSLSYGVTDDLEAGLTLPYRDLRSIFIDTSRPAYIGDHDADSAGFGDVEFDLRWRLVRDPVEFYLLAGVAMPTGERNNEDRLGRQYEVEFQPGTGAWKTTVGLGVARHWGRTSLHFEATHAMSEEGSQEYTIGDSTQIRFGGTWAPPLPENVPPIVLFGDILAQFNEPDVDNGETVGGHRAKLLYLVPGISFEPVERLSISVYAPIPVAQDWADHQEIDYSVRFSVGYSF